MLTAGEVRYLSLMIKTLTGMIYEDPPMDFWSDGRYDAERRRIGGDWPKTAKTMVGAMRLENILQLYMLVHRASVPGDLFEAGVWRGGAAIFMRAILEAYGDRARKVWLADSFQGLPRPDAQHFPADVDDRHSTFEALKVGLEEVRANFAQFDLLDDRVMFLPGWFKNTLTGCSVGRIAILRMDGDMYESTYQILHALYDRVSPGGFVIVDDYHLPNCRHAVEDFMSSRDISPRIIGIDGFGVYWRKGE